MRKDGGLKPGQEIHLRYSASVPLRKVIQAKELEIKGEVSAKRMELGLKENETFLVEKEIKLDNQKLWLGIKKK